MAVLNGTTKRLKIGDELIGSEFQSVLDVSVELPSTTNKESRGWSTHIQGKRSGSLSVSCFVDNDNDINFNTITGYLITKQPVSFSFEDDLYKVTGTGLIQSASEVANLETSSRYDIDIMLDGVLIQEAVSISYLLLETGDYLLLENGDRLILE